jgi:hypothetical protein
MNLKMITLKLAVAAMAAAMLLSQCMTDPEGTGSFRRSVNDTGTYTEEDIAGPAADGTEVADTVYVTPTQR